mgnify:CR=1 FL=1
MAQQSYRANLSSAIFPLSLSLAGSTVIVPGPDNNYDRRVDPEGEQKDAGIPQATYLENVIPTANGYQSVGYEILGPLAPGVTFDANFKPYRVAVIDGYTYLFGAVATTDTVYRTQDPGLGLWSDATVTWSAFAGFPYIEGFGSYNTLSQAIVRGTHYIYVRNGNTFGSVAGVTLTDLGGALTGIAVADINSITTSNNYLIAILTDNSIAWSSTTNPLDFVPSLVSGAGSITPEAVRGDIVAVHAIPEGFILYTETNSVLARYTGNARYPWKFTELANSGGHASERLIAAPKDSAAHFTINAQGSITQISADGAVRIAPEVSTYLRTFSAAYDLYNKTTRTFDTTQAYLSAYEIMFLANRYLIVQFQPTGSSPITPKCTIFYDILLRRYGRLGALPIFFWDDSSHIYCLTTTGKVCQLEFDIHNDDVSVLWDSVIALGKFKYVRSRRLELDEIVVTGELPSVTAAIVSSITGVLPSSGTALVPSDSNIEQIVYPSNAEGAWHILTLLGRFSLSSLELTFHLGGSR